MSGQTYTAVITVTKGTVTADNNAAPTVGIEWQQQLVGYLDRYLRAITALLKDAEPQGSTGAPGPVVHTGRQCEQQYRASSVTTLFGYAERWLVDGLGSFVDYH